MANSDNVLTKMHDLLLYIVPQLSKFPRDQKFVLGDRIETKLLEVQERCLRAYYGRDKRPHLIEANMLLETTRHLARLAHGLRLFSNQTYEVISKKIDETGRMIGGWIKQTSAAPTPQVAPTGAPTARSASDRPHAVQPADVAVGAPMTGSPVGASHP